MSRQIFVNHETLNVSDSDLEAVKELVDKLDPSWWLVSRHQRFLAYAFKLGRESVTKDNTTSADSHGV